MEEISMGSLTQEIDEQIKRALSIFLLKNITASSLCSHFADQPSSKKRAFNQQEIEILSRGTIRVNNLTRHLLYKLIKYTLPIKELTSKWNSPTTLDSFDVDFAYDVEILHKKNVVIDCTFEEYENLSYVVFPAIERLTGGELSSEFTILTKRLLSYLLRTYLEMDVQALIICLLVTKDGYISDENIQNLIVQLNDIRLSLSLDIIYYKRVNLTLKKLCSNKNTRHFICKRNGRYVFASQNAMDSVFLAFDWYNKIKKIQFDLLSVNEEFIRRYCRTSGYEEKKNELCFILRPCQTKLFISCLGNEIIDHPTLEDKETHALVCDTYNIPQEISRNGHEAINAFVKNLQSGKQKFYHARGMVVGCAGAGKTTLLEMMKSQNIPDVTEETRSLQVHECMFYIDNEQIYGCHSSESLNDVWNNNSYKNVTEQTISLLDFAGKCGYYDTHPIFFNKRSFFILVIDLTKSLDSVVEDTGSEGTSFEQWTYKDFVVFWMQSIHTYSSERAPVILVWTHADKVENAEEEMSKYYEKLNETLRNEDPALLQHLHKSMCFWIGIPRTSKKGNVRKDHNFIRENIEKIKETIMNVSKNLEHWGKEMPISWAVMERHIEEARKSHKLLFVEDLWKLNEKTRAEFQIKEKSVLDEILKFLHEVGEILYLPKSGRRGFVVLDIQWFVDAFKYIITDLRHANSDLEEDIKSHEDYKSFIEHGEMSYHLLIKIWGSFEGKELLKFYDDLVNYMEELGMMTNTAVLRKDMHVRASFGVCKRWYVPSMNRRIFNYEDFNIYSAASSILCFKFQFLPHIIFHKLIASCMEAEWKILSDSQIKCLYQRVAVFYRSDCFVFVGISKNRIEVQIRNLEEPATRKQRSDIRTELQNKLVKVKDNFHTDLHFKIRYKCSNATFCNPNFTEMLPKDIPRNRILCSLCPVPMKHYISKSDLTWKCESDYLQYYTPGLPNRDLSDFELLLDVVASRVSSDIALIAASLFLDQDTVDQILQDKQYYSMQEKIFQILYHWRNKHMGKRDSLYEALIDHGRVDVVNFLEKFARNHYKCPGVINPNLEITSTDIRIVSKEISHEFTRLARFLRLPQQKIERIKMNFKDNVNECILRTLESLQNVTRQDMCNSLVYISRMDITEKLLESWT